MPDILTARILVSHPSQKLRRMGHPAALRKQKDRLGREINVTRYSTDEFARKAAANDHFVKTVLKGKLEFVKGEQRDLDEITRHKRS
jgi:hypothetical protein